MSSNRAFTLLELLVVITIIGILSSIVIVSMSGSTDSATIAKGKAYAQQIHALLGANAVGVWNFDEGAGITVSDISGYGNDGTLAGNTHFVDSEIEGYSLSFDGTGDSVNCGNNSSLNITGPITIEAWIKKNIVDRRDDITLKITGYNFGAHNAAYNYHLFIQAQDSGGTWRGAYSNANAVTDTNWHHVVVSYERPAAKFYVDGQPWGTGTRDYDVISSNGYFYISPDAGNPFNGLIDGVRIYSTALPATEIQKHYVQGLEKLLSKQSITKAEYDQRMTEFNQSLVQNRF